MKLIQVKLRGTGPLIESNWIQLSGHLNQFHFPHSETGTIFLRALQTLHPPFSCTVNDPFAGLPLYEKRGSHTRHIQAAKRTIALGVFGANAELVTELGLLNENLYETDRIEIGRRLDYSRWLNFVEISSSTRWKDIEKDVLQLLNPLQHTDSQGYRDAISITSNLKGSDRVKGDVAKRFLVLIQAIEDQQGTNALTQETVALINRAAHFQTARKVVLQRLPLLIYFNSQGDIAAPISNEYQSSPKVHQELFQLAKQEGVSISSDTSALKYHNLNVVEKLRSGIHLSLLLSKELGRMNPIFLFDAPEIHTPSNEYGSLRKLIQETAQAQQCFYLSGSTDFFTSEEASKSYRSSQIEIVRD